MSSPKSRQALGGATILVTGGAGFIGSNFIRYLFKEESGVRIVCFDLLTYAGSRENLKDLPKEAAFTFVKGDVADVAAITRAFKKYRPDYVVNFAAESHVDRSIHAGASVFARTNALGVAVLLEAFRKYGGKKFVQVSTDEVYGSLQIGSRKRFTEKDPLAPTSPYAASKAAGDLIAGSFFATHGTPVVITRCSNNYGPYQYPEKMIPYQIARLVHGEPAALYGDGKNVRDWIHVEDHVRAILAALRHGVPGETYNIGADDESSNLALVRRLLRVLAKPASDISFITDRPGHDRRYAMDATKIRRELGWKPNHSLANSLASTVRWYQEHEMWTRRMLRNGVNAHIEAGRGSMLIP